MGKIMTDELWDNFSFIVRDDRTGQICYVNIKDFFEQTEVVRKKYKRKLTKKGKTWTKTN